MIYQITICFAEKLEFRSTLSSAAQFSTSVKGHNMRVIFWKLFSWTFCFFGYTLQVYYITEKYFKYETYMQVTVKPYETLHQEIPCFIFFEYVFCNLCYGIFWYVIYVLALGDNNVVAELIKRSFDKFVEDVISRIVTPDPHR